MSRTIRSPYSAVAILLLSSLALAPALGQTVTYKYGFCLGVAGLPPANYVTRAFVLGSTNVDLRAEFMHSLGDEYGGNVRRDATGCRMFLTASEAEQAHSQLLDQSRTMTTPLVAIDWIPKGATPLTAAAAPGIKTPG